MATTQTVSLVGLLAHQKLELAKKDKDTKKLKDVNAKTIELLGDIHEALASISNLRSQNWRKAIKKLQDEYLMQRFVIGVLGATGSGKSSLINAILDEERIVPTNCMRACTAVITEISWNQSEDPAKKYRAEIEFITQAEWTTEVISLRRDILDPNGRISPDVRNAESDAGIAYAVLKTVYPEHTDAEFRDTDPAVLASFERVQEVIGTTQVVEEAECDSFYSKIQSFVDSQEKRGQNGLETANTANATPQKQSMAFWPLIKVVRVFLKSDVVSTGVVLVDLPGGHDSNATRAAVAEKYVKECSRLWIVAPINRAVDDKTARTLLGDHFKQQLKYDGAYTNITFICTKADEISIDEAASTLGIGEFIAKQQQRTIQMKTQMEERKHALALLDSQKLSTQEKVVNARNEVAMWNDLRKQVTKGHKTFAPVLSPQKRKRSQSETDKEAATAKKVKKETSSDTDDYASDESDLDEEDDNDDDQRDPLTLEETCKKLDDLKAVKKAADKESRALKKHMSQLKAEIKDLKKQCSATKTDMYRVCIQGRNDYSRRYIKSDFASGLKELDEEVFAEQRQEDAQRAQGNAPDYEKIGEDLPVFCISSRGYQQLKKRMKKDHRIDGFTSLDDTEVPGLRNHTLQLATSIQVIHFRHRLNNICRLLGALDLFIAGDVANSKLSDNEKQNETKNLERSLSVLRKALGEAIARCIADCRVILNQGIIEKIGSGASKAAEKALPTAEGWSAKYDAGGLRYNTYKAICRRLANTHPDLLKPMKTCAAHDWDLTFRNRLPETLKTLAASMKHHIDGFHARMKNRRFLVENDEIVSEIFTKLLIAQKETLVHISNEQQKLVQESGKEANRLFGPAIQGAMLQAYNACNEQNGLGCFTVMKEIMTTYVESTKNTMFADAARDIEKAVNRMLEDLEKMIMYDAASVINAMQEDYIGLIGEVANEADSRTRKTLGPVLKEFYQKLNVALTPTPEEPASETIGIDIKGEASDDDDDDEYQPEDDDSD
ncbi:hypothetical protein CSUB01_00407 [Colletotrichum sublineola]|uniref:Tat pathway signal sequence n=1 Tax=Colletotrichum sublineola TaxID=1173701 RepID=A0A066XEK0_COLSU|nr:hypothetical protein CSUB01_00407 [Colletotrichum sublineola]